MNRITNTQLEELENAILDLSEYDKLEITLKNGKVDVIKKSTRKIVFYID